jgi:thiamine pyrophosphate-dependent acetolactate synthase large subunit-like protein
MPRSRPHCCQGLKDHGVREIFGIPGDFVLPFFRVIEDSGATGRRPLVLVGDGAFQMIGWELGNCRRYGFDPVVVLFNNASWEMLCAFQPESRFNDLDDWNSPRSRLRWADTASA